MNRAAQQIGRLAKGVPKTLTKAERARRAKSLAVARAKRWPAKSNAPALPPQRSGGRQEQVVGGLNQEDET